MNELYRIQDQIARSLDGEAWHGPALMEVLSGVDARAAMARAIPNAHSIWEILLHVSASVELVLARLRGEARTLSPEEDWPAPPAAADQDAWEADVRLQVLEVTSGISQNDLAKDEISDSDKNWQGHQTAAFESRKEER